MVTKSRSLGPSGRSADLVPQSFAIHVPDALLADLDARLRSTRWPDQLEGVGWAHGSELSYVRELCTYWRERFDWRARERELNRLPQFTMTVDDLDLHFVHWRSAEAGALPVLLLHGWPSSFAEFHKVIEPLAVGASPASTPSFHVVCPSLPGFAFSEAPRRAGFDVKSLAQVLADLMERLGYESYGIQGGDLGALAGSWLAALYPERVAGLHLNMVVAPPPVDDPDPLEGAHQLDSDALAGLMVIRDEYVPLLATNPQTLSYALNDSPAGLLAWILHKFWRWSGHEGDLERSIPRDDLLTNVMLYWVTQSIASSHRIFFETRASRGPLNFGELIPVPTGCALFPREPYRVPRRWAERQYRIVRWTELPRGGHFPALEEPELLIGDMRAFFGELCPAPPRSR